MLERRPPIDGRRSDRFRPPHCPWPECRDHLHRGPGYRYKRDGYYRRKRDPRRRNPRFRCLACRRGFSMRTFSPRHYLKRPELLEPIARLLVSGCAHRQIARFLDCAPSTVTRMSVRLGRHAEHFHELALAHLGRIDEPIVFDHFDTFVRSQVERLGLATAVGEDSWFVYDFRGARFRGSPRRSRRKRALKRRPAPPPPGQIVDSTLKMLQRLTRRAPSALRLITDHHAAYPAALRRLARRGSGTTTIHHEIHVSPQRLSSDDRVTARSYREAMFPVNLLHTLLRHSQAHHRRETIAYGRKSANAVGRAAILAVWRNFIKLRTERRPCKVTPAIQLGLTPGRWAWGDLLAERLFPARIATTNP